MRKEHEKRTRELGKIYMAKLENSGVGKTIRERMGFKSNESQGSESPRAEFERDMDGTANDQGGKKKKSVKIFEGKENSAHAGNEDHKSRAGPVRSSLSKPKAESRSPSRGRQSRSASKKRDDSPPQYNSPRQKLYEAKFEKYLANKE